MAERDAETAHRYKHHPITRYDPDSFVPVEDPVHHEFFVHHELVEGLPVHNKYGERVIEHDPYHQEYVHGTNYELVGQHSEPVIEHNPHAFPSKADKRKTVPHLSKHTPPPKEKVDPLPKVEKAPAPKKAKKPAAEKPKAKAKGQPQPSKATQKK